jgi:hypothetical protein
LTPATLFSPADITCTFQDVADVRSVWAHVIEEFRYVPHLIKGFYIYPNDSEGEFLLVAQGPMPERVARRIDAAVDAIGMKYLTMVDWCIKMDSATGIQNKSLIFPY